MSWGSVDDEARKPVHLRTVQFHPFIDLKVVMFKPGGGPPDGRTGPTKGVPRMTAGRAAPAGPMDRYTRALLDPFVTLLEVHKLLYFKQESGEPLGLRYRKGA